MQRPWTSNPSTKPGRRAGSGANAEYGSLNLLVTNEIPEEDYRVQDESIQNYQIKRRNNDDTRISVSSYLTAKHHSRTNLHDLERKRRSQQIGSHLLKKPR